jgi:predicted DNA-binding protein
VKLTAQIGLRLSDETALRLGKLARLHSKSPGALVRELLDREWEKAGRKADELDRARAKILR